MFENPRRGRQARNLTTNVPKILDLKSSSEKIFSENCRWVLLFVDLHFGQPWLSSSKTSSSVCELPSRVRFIFLSLRASQDIFGLLLGITELFFCEKWPYSRPRRSNFNIAIEIRPPWSASTPDHML